MPDASTDISWIEELTDEQCMEVFWLYVDPPEPFLNKFPPQLLGQSLRFALREVAHALTEEQLGQLRTGRVVA